jgi:hypothetical protein
LFLPFDAARGITMNANRNLAQELKIMEITNIEANGFLSSESIFAAIDAIGEHEKQFPIEGQVKQIEKISRQTYKNMSPATHSVM